MVRHAGTRDGGVRSDYSRFGRGFYLLRRAKRPAVLVEAGYISNPQTERLLASAAYRQRLADGIADGIIQYLN
jgi:N-acetylmuramoyl-L-alanine amidase